MNYSKDSKSKKNESTKSKSNKDEPTNNKKKKKKTKITIFRILLVSFIIAIFAVFGAGLGLFIGVIKSAPDVSELELKPTTDYTSFIFDENGEEMDRLSGGENRIYATLDQIPLHLQQAVVAIEDERFYEHNGIDIKGILRAIVKNFSTGELTEGASTITQQLIKNNILTTEKKFTRKIQEQYLAIQFEKVYAQEYGQKGAKDLILEYYLNTMPLGRGTNGVQAAANRYFNKNVSELTLGESVVLACITQAPTKYDPISNPENNYEKSERILIKMVEQGYITEEEKNVALIEDPYKNIQAANQKHTEKANHSYFVDALIDSVIDDLQAEKGMTLPQANNLLFGGGVSIYTTFNPAMQESVDNYMSDDSLFPNNAYELKLNYSVTVKKADGTIINRGGEGIVKSEDEVEAFKQSKLTDWGITAADTIQTQNLFRIPQPQAAFVVTDHTNGHVKALSGGRGDKEGDRTFNRATQAKRQPGSTFKVLAAYAPALDMGLLAPGSVIIDEPLTIELPGDDYSPRNWNSKFIGPTTVRKAIWNSMNVVAVKTTNMVGIENAFNYLLNFGFTTLLPTDKVHSLPLGGLTEGVTPMELNAAYAAIANGGTYIEPILYTKIVDRDGNIILENTPESHSVISESTASMLTDMMEGVINVSSSTGYGLNNTFKGMSVAGKTGTTSDDKDLLFSGYTPYYTATIWMGHDEPKRLAASGREHINIWGSIMNEIHDELPPKDFVKVTTGYVKASVCAASGKAPTSLCKLDPNHSITTDYFHKGDVISTPCDVHVEQRVCITSGKIAGEYCPADAVVTSIISKNSSQGNSLCDVHTEFNPVEEPEPEIDTGGNEDNFWPWPGEDGTQPPEGNTVPDNSTTTPDNPPVAPPQEVVPPTSEVAPTPPAPNPDDFFVPQG
ncbi:MAG: PBP1A family penicillin-binding protein [Cellulosilyticaceae bacterium]